MSDTSAGTIRSEVRIALDRLRGDIRNVERLFDRIGTDSRQTSNEVEDNFTQGFGAVELAGVAAFAGIGIAVNSAIDTFAGFEQSLANVGAVAGATEEEFQVLENAAREAGATTRFSASEAADALFFLSSAGFDATQSVESLNGVLTLAGATSSDLSQTAQTVTAVISQFGLAASDATRVANIFAAANQNSQATLSRLQTAFRQTGAIAGQFGIEVEETTGALQALFNAGLEGEQAGTALRNILLELSDSSSTVSQALIDAGVSFEDFNPRAVGLTESFETLSEAGIDLSTVFGSEAVGAALILQSAASDTENSLRDLTAAVTDTNAAAQSYAIQNDTLAGSFDTFRSAAQETAISIVNEFLPALRGAVDAGTAFLRFIAGTPEPIRIFLGVMLGAIPILGAVGTALTAFGVSVTAALGPIGLAVVGVAGVTAAVTTLSRSIRENRIEQLEEDFGQLSNQLELSVEEIEAVDNALRLGGFGAFTFQSTVDQVSALAVNLGLTRDQVVQIGLESETVSEAYKEQLRLVQDQLREQQEINDNLAEQQLLQQQLDGLARGTLEFIDGEIRARETAAEQRRREIREQRELEQQREEAARLERERVEGIIAARTAAEQVYREQLNSTEALLNLGFIDQVERNDRLIQANEQLVESLVGIGYDGLRGERGDLAIQRAIELIGQLTEENEELADAEAEATETLSVQARERIAALDAQISRQNLQSSLLQEGLEQEELDFETSLLERERTLLRLGESQVDIAADLAQQRADREIAEQERANRERIESIIDFNNEVFGLSQSFFDALSNFYRADADRRIEEQDRILQNELEGNASRLDSAIETLDERTRAILEANDLQELSTLDRLQNELDQTRATLLQEIDEEQRALLTMREHELQNEIDRTQILEDAERQRSELIAAAESERQQLTEQAEQEKAEIRYRADLIEWNADRLRAAANLSAAIIRTFAQFGFTPAGFAAEAIGAVAAGVELAAINASRPQAPQLQTGGIVIPQAGGAQVVVAENNNAELLLNGGASGESFLNMFADRIADRILGTTTGANSVTVIQNNTLNTDTLANIQRAAQVLAPAIEQENRRRG